MQEIWKDVVDYEGLYKVSNFGRIKSCERKELMFDVRYRTKKEKILKESYIDGYCKVNLYKNGKSKSVMVHRLVAIAFIDNAFNKPQVNHINGIKNDNRVVNLEWCTQSENMKHSYKEKLHVSIKGEKHPHSKLKREDVIRIRMLYESKEYNQREIADMYNVQRDTVSKIINRKRWKHV